MNNIELLKQLSSEIHSIGNEMYEYYARVGKLGENHGDKEAIAVNEFFIKVESLINDKIKAL